MGEGGNRRTGIRDGRGRMKRILDGRQRRQLKLAIGNAGSSSRALIFITKNEKMPKEARPRREMRAGKTEKILGKTKNSTKKEER